MVKRIGIVIQARLDSTRLCHKVLRSIGSPGPTVLEIICCQSQRAHLVNTVALTTPDLALFYLARDTFGVCPWLWTGPRDPLSEYRDVAEAMELDVVVRLTGDCPMITGEIIDAAVEEFFRQQVDILYNGTDGADVEVFTCEALAIAYEAATAPQDREHVTLWMKRNLRYRELPPLVGQFKSLDTPEDYRLICKLMAEKYSLPKVDHDR